jgi:hypothetical protein
MMLAGGEGLEPPQADPESAVLPLDEPPKCGTGQILPLPSGFVQVGEDLKTQPQNLAGGGAEAAENYGILYNASRRAIAVFNLSRTFGRPITAILSNRGGLTF